MPEGYGERQKRGVERRKRPANGLTDGKKRGLLLGSKY
jgi:hypothetical protein